MSKTRNLQFEVWIDGRVYVRAANETFAQMFVEAYLLEYPNNTVSFDYELKTFTITPNTKP